ncbi:MAG: BspA family leucine-rich repeat surface protein, partial [Holdemanella sp.]|nr:BspA family leucine-rich repeat surface protein [Holdemanella sp.]
NAKSMFDYCSSLEEIIFPGTLNTSKVNNFSYMFRNCSSLPSINLTLFDTSGATDMTGMFRGCSALTSLDVSHFNTSNVTSMTRMFSGCKNLETLDVTSLNTSNVTDMDEMFSDCYKLAFLDVTNFNTGNVTNMSYMFYECNALTSLDLSSFNTSKVKDMEYMFSSCFKLKTINLSSFDMSKATTTRIFNGCRDCETIILPVSFINPETTVFDNSLTSLKTINYTGKQEEWDEYFKDVPIPEGVTVNCLFRERGWYEEDGKRFYILDNNIKAIGWTTIDGNTYYFGNDGYLQTGVVSIPEENDIFLLNEYVKSGWQLYDNIWYYCKANGSVTRGKQVIGNKTYYFDDMGAMQTGIVDNYYYNIPNGQMENGWKEVDGNWYYFNPADNRMVTSKWIKSGNSWYYLQEDGVMAADGKVQDYTYTSYCFDKNGAMVTGWQYVDDHWYYFEASGAMATSKWIGNYYVGYDGAMLRDVWIGNYYVNESGLWVPGKERYSWVNDADIWYLYDEAAEDLVRSDWKTVKGKQYYFNEYGVMATNFYPIEDDYYFFGSDGAMKTGWQKIGYSWFYFNAEGKMQRACWVGDYYLNINGIMVSYCYVLNEDNGKYYWVDNTGKYIAKWTTTEKPEGYTIYNQQTGEKVLG